MSLKTAFMTTQWIGLFERFNLCSKRLQSGVDVAEIYQSLIFYINDLWADNKYDDFWTLRWKVWEIEDFPSIRVGS